MSLPGRGGGRHLPLLGRRLFERGGSCPPVVHTCVLPAGCPGHRLPAGCPLAAASNCGILGATAGKCGGMSVAMSAKANKPMPEACWPGGKEGTHKVVHHPAPLPP